MGVIDEVLMVVRVLFCVLDVCEWLKIRLLAKAPKCPLGLGPPPRPRPRRRQRSHSEQSLQLHCSPLALPTDPKTPQIPYHVCYVGEVQLGWPP